MEQNGVAIAFDIVLEEIENAIAALNQQGAQAFQGGKYDVARDLIGKGSHMAAFRSKVHDLQKEWINIFATVSPPKTRKGTRKVAERSQRGLRTPEDAFCIPILQSLIELGGSAPVSDVLDKVEAKMRSQLNAYDRSPLPSDSTLTRWRNTAQWARKAMVQKGLMSSDSPRGIWEITEAGRRWLVVSTTQKK